MATEIRRLPGDVLLHWSVPVAIAVLLLNDHWAKERWGNAATGKISDVAGMFFGPILLASLWELVRRRPVSPSAFRTFALAFGAAFVALKVAPPVADVVEVINGVVRGAPTVIVHDPTDALALVALLPSVLLWNRARGGQSSRTRCTSLTRHETRSASVGPSPSTST
jgi:hypothetical protein